MDEVAEQVKFIDELLSTKIKWRNSPRGLQKRVKGYIKEILRDLEDRNRSAKIQILGIPERKIKRERKDIV